MRALLSILLLTAFVAGCSEPEPRVEYITTTQVVTETVTVTIQPAPASFMRIDKVHNSADIQYEMRVQPYTVTGSGSKSTSGYNVVLISAKAGTTMNLGPETNPKCDDRMQGIFVKLWADGKEKFAYDWSGVHCQNDAKAFSFIINADGSMTMNAH